MCCSFHMRLVRDWFYQTSSIMGVVRSGRNVWIWYGYSGLERHGTVPAKDRSKITTSYAIELSTHSFASLVPRPSSLPSLYYNDHCGENNARKTFKSPHYNREGGYREEGLGTRLQFCHKEIPGQHFFDDTKSNFPVFQRL